VVAESLRFDVMVKGVEAMASKGTHKIIVRARATAWKADVDDV
jgi:hypothetical protein